MGWWKTDLLGAGDGYREGDDVTDALLIQQGFDAESGRYFSLYYDRHVEYCIRHRFDYWCHMGPVRHMGDRDPWTKLALVQSAFLQGYSNVIWLDMDAFIYDIKMDLRAACLRPINMSHWTYPTPHLQAGVIYFNNASGKAYEIVSRCLEEKKYYLERFPTLRGWFEQGQLNEVSQSPGMQISFMALGPQWNWSSHFCEPVEHVVIRSWHGTPEPDRYREMSQLSQQLRLQSKDDQEREVTIQTQ